VANFLVILAVLAVGLYVGSVVRRRRSALFPKRGFGVRADLDGVSDAPRVRVRALQRTAPDRVAVTFAKEAGPGDAPPEPPFELEFIVLLQESEFGSGLLEEWQQAGSSIALVIPPGSRLLRLRSLDTLQHLTLRRIDG
jgi:hypothetical protein